MVHHHHHHHHGHEHPEEGADPGAPRAPVWASRRFLVAAFVVAALVMSASVVFVSPGTAVVVTRFGNPVRVLTSPGIALKFPAPIENVLEVDLRLRTTSSGLHDVGTRDGLRVLAQAYIAWQIPQDAERIRLFLRAVRNQPEIAAEQLRSFTGSSLEIVASGFDLESLVNTEPGRIELDRFEATLRAQIDAQALSVYGITVRQVGLERLTLPSETLSATIERMRAERETVAAERSAEGQRVAAQIQSNAERDARVVEAQAKASAAEIEAKARVEAASIYKQAYSTDPKLYTLLRSFDSLDSIVGSNSRFILRTDAPPFRVLTESPQASSAGSTQSQAAR